MTKPLGDLDFVLNTIRAADAFQRCPDYRPTPLIQRAVTGETLWLKDERNRLGLGSFKALGGAYAIARLVAHAAGTTDNAGPMDPRMREAAKAITFVCASAGNHGLSVAAGARLFGARARVHLPLSAPPEFQRRIRAEGAAVLLSGETYDDAMRAARDDAARDGGVWLSDCAFSTYEIGPALVMEGYTLIAREMAHQFAAADSWPTHIFVQAGVGGLAAALAYEVRTAWTRQPELVVVEPETAACVAAAVTDPQAVETAGPSSIMHRLDCKRASSMAARVLKAARASFVSVSDDEAERAAAMLAQAGFATTPSGAAGLAGLIRHSPDEDARPAIIITEDSMNPESGDAHA
ncbi:MAG: pyridoxal-phosphate dependent enzyme [Alphaproteobacteria bacterium]|nr:pyridoxal-phosphate dependent enzyme [Alphaproteobacteria bacterium]